jgi:hypothetical protein
MLHRNNTELKDAKSTHKKIKHVDSKAYSDM